MRFKTAIRRSGRRTLVTSQGYTHILEFWKGLWSALRRDGWCMTSVGYILGCWPGDGQTRCFRYKQVDAIVIAALLHFRAPSSGQKWKFGRKKDSRPQKKKETRTVPNAPRPAMRLTRNRFTLWKLVKSLAESLYGVPEADSNQPFTSSLFWIPHSVLTVYSGVKLVFCFIASIWL